MTNTILFYGDFTSGGTAVAPSPAPTVAIYAVLRSTGVESVAVAGGTACTVSALTGRYYYRLTTADLSLYDYHARFTTTDTTVDAQDVPALWVRWSEAVATDSTGGVNTTKLAGQTVTAASGVTFPSAVGDNDKTGYALSAAGLDAVPVESGVNARQALSPILAASAGVISGQDSNAPVIKAGGNPSVTRIAATTDDSGNRTSVTLTLPT